MKKIAYIEIDTHAEIAQAFMDIMQDSQDFAVDYYFSKKIKDQIRSGHEAVFLSDSSMILDQLKEKNYDLIMIGTVHRYFTTFFTLIKKYNTAVIAHNLNFTKASKPSLLKSIFKGDVIYRLKLWLKEGLLYSSKIYLTSQSLLVLDEAMASERYQFLPLFYTKDFPQTDNEHRIIVIPGGVSQKRRNYQYIFTTIQHIKADQSYEFVFLGKAKDHELKQLGELSQKLPENIRITYFSDRVSSYEFNQWMQKADVLWCPIQQETEFFSMKETYGVTKMTGNLGDAVVYGKWAVFPSAYPSKLNFIVPEGENFLRQVNELARLNYDFRKEYGKEEILKKTEKLLMKLTSG
ncbi:hypothetical protein [Chryseobacterium sp.]|uniref:hypothetical protein n=1 Tax=Chryseobacterium sp. TaxID=1871047 RepID=UPI0025BD0B53|nr:hypothetical protein [Chryseobacterium sp.]MBV8328400.1 hypothetical protein [Chryseobacterium sp.]